MGTALRVILALTSLSGWLLWTIIWWYGLWNDWKVPLIINRFNEQWIEGVLIHALTVFSLLYVVITMAAAKHQKRP